MRDCAFDAIEPDQDCGISASASTARNGDAADAEVALLPLCPTQARLWFLYAASADRALHHATLVLEMAGGIDDREIAARLRGVVGRHPALRSCYTAEGKRLAASALVPLAQHDLTALDGAAAETAARQAMRDAVDAPFDLSAGPVIRAALLRRSPDEARLIVVVHAIACDESSLAILAEELAAGAPRVPAASGQADLLSPVHGAAPDPGALPALAARYAARMHRGGSGTILPPDHTRPPVQTHQAGQVRRHLPTEMVGDLREMAEIRGWSLLVAVLAVAKLTLLRHTGEADIVVGLRLRDPAAPPGIGQHGNTLLLGTALDLTISGNELLRRIAETAREAAAFVHVPFATLIAAARPDRDPSLAPLRQIEVALRHAPAASLQGGAAPGWRVGADDSARIGTDLEFTIVLQADGGADLLLRYNAGLYEAARMARLAGHFVALAAALPRNPHRAVGLLPMLGAAETVLLESFAGAALPACPHRTVHGWFAAQAAATPDALALFHAGACLSYAELNAAANRLAHGLAARGIRPGSHVGIHLRRDRHLLVAMLAVLKAGCAYVPLDPAYPPSRVALMAEDAGLAALLSDAASPGDMPGLAVPAIALDALRAECATAPAQDGLDPAGPRSLSHLIYTSGSTGRPKGIMIEHRNVLALLQWAHGEFDAAALSHVLASTSICFDLSVFELFAPLTAGGAVHLVENALLLPQCPTRDQVSLVNTVPSAMAELLRHGALPPSVRVVALAGEPLHRELVARVQAQPQVQAVYNLYGPSEDTTYSTFARMPDDIAEAPTIGRPLPGKRVHILDAAMRPVPLGVIGEIHIGGAGVARGYHARPELNAKAFVTDPASGDVLYRTGDLGRFLPDGRIVYAGRTDHQIKVHGFRIELGEIEDAVRGHAGVQACVVVLREEAAGKLIVAYAAAPGGVDAASLRAHVAARLPGFMVPGAFVCLPALPMTPNGKVDRAALPPPLPPAAAAAHAPEITQGLERDIAEIWKDLLKLDHVGLDQNFFEIGGHSLLLLQMHVRLRALAGRDFEIIELFRQPTIRAQRRLLAPTDSEAAGTDTAGGDRSAFAAIAERMRKRRAALADRHPAQKHAPTNADSQTGT